MSINVTKEFIESFNLCMDYYGVSEDEIEYEKKRVRQNYEDAYKCYMDIAVKLKG